MKMTHWRLLRPQSRGSNGKDTLKREDGQRNTHDFRRYVGKKILCFDHSNTRLFQYSDPHCTIFFIETTLMIRKMFTSLWQTTNDSVIQIPHNEISILHLRQLRWFKVKLIAYLLLQKLSFLFIDPIVVRLGCDALRLTPEMLGVKLQPLDPWEE